MCSRALNAIFRASVAMSNGLSRRPHHARSSNMGSGHAGLHDHENSTSFSRPPHQGSVAQSRFEVHISPTAFSPIVIPSSTPPESVTTSSLKHREISVFGAKYGVVNAEHTPRVGEEFTHSQSQPSVSPNKIPTSRARSRRHGIPANFLESVGAASGGMKTPWNGQSLSADQYMNSQNFKDKSPSSFRSQPALVQPSASAPVTSCLSNTDTGLISTGPASGHESRTDPASSIHSSSHTTLTRGLPSHNLARPPPPSSGITDRRRTTEVGQRAAQRNYHGGLPQPSLCDALHRSQCSPQPLSSSSLNRASESTVIHHQPSKHRRTSPSLGSETEIGYQGLAFPLPPSGDEGLAMSFSSSQSFQFSPISARRSGDQPSTEKTRDGKLRSEHEHDARQPGSTESRGAVPGSGRSARDRDAGINMSENRASPTPNARLTRRKVEGATEHFERAQTNGLSTHGEPDIKHQDCVAKELEEVLGVKSQHDEFSDDSYHPTTCVHATSEALHSQPVTALPQKQPESTKPLVLNPSRKTLQTMRSFTTLTERKQLQASSSSRDLAGAFNGANARGEHVRTATAIPVPDRLGVRHDREGQATVSITPIQNQRSEEESSTPPRFPLPTPPNSSSTLFFLANETRSPEEALSRPHLDLEMSPAPPLTLEEVREVLRAQRVRFDELSSYVLDVAQQHTAEKDAYVLRVERLEGTITKLEREIRGLRWLVLKHPKAPGGAVSGPDLIINAAAVADRQRSEGKKCGDNNESVANHRTLRRSSTMSQLLTPAEKPRHARNRRYGGLGLDFSPESAGSSPFTLSSLSVPSQFEVDMGDEEHTPSMDEIIDKLMAVRQWAGSDVRVSVVESTGRPGDSKRIVFRQV